MPSPFRRRVFMSLGRFATRMRVAFSIEFSLPGKYPREWIEKKVQSLTTREASSL